MNDIPNHNQKSPPAIDFLVERERLDLLYSRTPTVISALMVITTVYLFLHSSSHSWKRLSIYALLILLSLSGRGLLYCRYKQARHNYRLVNQTVLSAWRNGIRLVIFLTGVLIGSLCLVFPAPISSALFYFQLVFPIAILAATVIMLPDLALLTIYSLSLLMPELWCLVTTGKTLYYGCALLILVLAFFFYWFARELEERFITSTRLKYENQALLAELAREKRKVDNRLAQILNDNSNEIYVLDGQTLKCLQVNRGAVQNRGWNREEFNELRITDILVGLDEAGFAKMFQPLYQEPGRSIVHRGMSRRKDGSLYPIEARIQVSLLEAPILVISVRDVTERSEWEKKLIYQANFDQLTGLFNRHYMQSYMESVFARVRRSQSQVGVLFLDLDNFKHINDTHGHATGDEVLQQTAARIRELLRKSDTPARTGGDEFTILLENINSAADIENVARKLVERFVHPFVLGEGEIYTTVSIGICIFPDDGESLTQIMQHADMAMYRAKLEGRNGYCFFSAEMSRQSQEKMKITSRLRSAWEKREFTLYYQPIIDLKKQRISGAEALLRWPSPELGQVSPDRFVLLAESLGLMDELGAWVIEEACREAATWHQSKPGIRISVNVSSQQIRSGRLLDDVRKALAVSSLPPQMLQLEITESLLLQDSVEVREIFAELRRMGLNLALDDFGTGYSSLSYLHRFPLQVLKVDRSFIREMDETPHTKTLVRAIIAMAHSLELEVVAEGIENQLQVEFLRRCRVSKIQGYFFSPAVPAAEFRNLLEHQTLTNPVVTAAG
jgi:diguanylate cyclase (GGDEF)-like protein/PAS domain S-box-containing protein